MDFLFCFNLLRAIKSRSLQTRPQSFRIHCTLDRLLASFTLVLCFKIINYFVYTFVSGVFWEALDLGKGSLFEIYLVLFAIEHPLVVYQNLFWKTFKDPFVL